MKNSIKRFGLAAFIAVEATLLVYTIGFHNTDDYDVDLSADHSLISITEAAAELPEAAVESDTQLDEVLTDEDTDAACEPVMLESVVTLYDKNNDLHAWIQIDNLSVSLPVVYTPDDYDKYLRLDYEGNSSVFGTLFLQADTNIHDQHTIIFGHNTRNGTYFGGLKKYCDQDYLEANKTFFISDLYEVYEYEIVAAVLDCVHDKSDDTFKYYYYTDNSGYAFEDFRDWVIENAVSLNNVSILTEDATVVQLITCSSHIEDGRLVIVAVRR